MGKPPLREKACEEGSDTGLQLLHSMQFALLRTLLTDHKHLERLHIAWCLSGLKQPRIVKAAWVQDQQDIAA